MQDLKTVLLFGTWRAVFCLNNFFFVSGDFSEGRFSRIKRCLCRKQRVEVVDQVSAARGFRNSVWICGREGEVCCKERKKRC